jgi:hypothetical protein
MLTQQELVDRLNQLTLRYNLTWFDVKFDADKAITKINNFLGAKYPKLTQYMVAPNSKYTIPTFFKIGYSYDNITYQANTIAELQTLVTAAGGPNPMVAINIITYNTEYEIIPEEYFHSVIIPYIAAEVLARDEEFTTIYNKYVLEMQEGLYDMFQREFNKVPFEFRQNPDQGVFFSLDSQEGISQHNERNLNVPTFKFNVTYYANNNEIALVNALKTDLKAYTYGEEASLLFVEPNEPGIYSTDYSKVFTFKGWARESNVNQAVYVRPPEPPVTIPVTLRTPVIVKMYENLRLYAVWDVARTLVVDGTSGTKPVTILSAHRASLVNLVIPEFINGLKALTIPSGFITDNLPATDLLKAVYVPKNILTLAANSFSGFSGTTIQLSEGLTTINTNAFANTPNLTEIIIPSTVTTITGNAFPVVANKNLVIKTRVLLANKPAGWANVPTSPLTQAYTVIAGTTLTAVSGAVTAGISVGQNVTGTGIPANTVVTSVTSATIVISNSATASGAQTLTFTGWYAASTSTYTVEVIWGYNG